MSKPQYVREPLTTDEQDRLMKACRTGDERLVIWTLLETGLRVSELAQVTRENIDYQTHRITIMGKGGTRGPLSKRRVLKLSPVLRELLEPHLAVHESLGVSVRTIQRTVERVARRADIKRAMSPHYLRHTFAVRALQKGMTLVALRDWLGHASLQTTELYLNLSPDAMIEEFDKKW